MKCYYEELGVERDANDADIKTAYRKLALRWHPDKNPDSLEEAKERFQLIQQAYEVLSDGHERAWYDNHREQILRGKNSEYEDNVLDVFQYFTVSCYKGYGNDAQGFYAVYREVFQKIAAEDVEFMDDEEELAGLPTFGDSQSNYEEVVGPFYAHWQSYCTKKTYTWLCPYDIQEIRDRRVLREIEKEMKKVVQKARRERNEEVRNLVAFVRKRDRRAQAYKRQLEERAALNRQKQEQNRLEQIRRRQQELKEMRESNQHVLGEGYEEQLKQLELQYGSDSSATEDDEAYLLDDANAEADEDDYLDDLYCVACNKAFRNEKAFANHETSKKHRENVERMKQEMLEEEEEYRESEETSEVDSVEQAAAVEDDKTEEEEEEVTKLTDSEEEIPAAPVTQSKKDKKAKKANKNKGNTAAVATHELDEVEIEESDFMAHSQTAADSDAEDWTGAAKKGAKKNKAKGKQSKKPAEPKMVTEANKESVTAASAPPVAPVVFPAAAPVENGDSATSTPVCVTCHATFPSKNKLFAHLKLMNHGVYIPKAKSAVTLDAGKQKKGKAKRK